MRIQSLSIVVPNTKCINNCKFCVACMNNDSKDYINQLEVNLPFYDLYLTDYIKRLNYCRDNGTNTVMLTGNSEPQQNKRFLTDFSLFNRLMNNPFNNIEMQTTGVMLDENYLRFLRNHVGVNTISLSISSFNDIENKEIIGVPSNLDLNISNLCGLIKRYNFNLRLSVNLSKYMEGYSVSELFHYMKMIGADQITFRELFTSGDTVQDNWIRKNDCSVKFKANIREYIKTNGHPLNILEYGLIRYSVDGMSTVLDDDCMNQELGQDFKYLILRPDCKLYSRWEDKASLIF